MIYHQKQSMFLKEESDDFVKEILILVSINIVQNDILNMFVKPIN